MVALDAPLLVTARTPIWPVEAAVAHCIGHCVVGAILLGALFHAPSGCSGGCGSALGVVVKPTPIILLDGWVVPATATDILLGTFLAFPQMPVGHLPVFVKLSQVLLNLSLETHLAAHLTPP